MHSLAGCMFSLGIYPISFFDHLLNKWLDLLVFCFFSPLYVLGIDPIECVARKEIFVTLWPPLFIWLIFFPLLWSSLLTWLIVSSAVKCSLISRNPICQFWMWILSYWSSLQKVSPMPLSWSFSPCFPPEVSRHLDSFWVDLCTWGEMGV